MDLQARLIERSDAPDKIREIPINTTEFLIGRGPDCDLRLPLESVSRHHCIIRMAPEEVVLLDLGSSNGTYLNRERVRSQAVVKSGDQIDVGTCTFVLVLGDDSTEFLPSAGVDPLRQTVKLPRK